MLESSSFKIMWALPSLAHILWSTRWRCSVSLLRPCGLSLSVRWQVTSDNVFLPVRIRIQKSLAHSVSYLLLSSTGVVVACLLCNVWTVLYTLLRKSALAGDKNKEWSDIHPTQSGSQDQARLEKLPEPKGTKTSQSQIAIPKSPPSSLPL